MLMTQGIQKVASWPSQSTWLTPGCWTEWASLGLIQNLRAPFRLVRGLEHSREGLRAALCWITPFRLVL